MCHLPPPHPARVPAGGRTRWAHATAAARFYGRGSRGELESVGEKFDLFDLRDLGIA